MFYAINCLQVSLLRAGTALYSLLVYFTGVIFLFFFFLLCSFYHWHACLCVCLVTQSYLTFGDPVDCSPRGSSVHGDSPGKDTGVGCHALLQGIFPTQGLNPGLPHCRWILYCLGHHLNTVKSGWSGLERQLYKDPQAPVQAWGTQQGFIIIK